MSMHKIPLTQVEEDGLRAHGLDIGTPSQLSDAFRQGVVWGKKAERDALWRNFERECDDTDRLLKDGIGWTPDRTRTEGGSLKVAELSDAMRSMMTPGSGG